MNQRQDGKHLYLHLAFLMIAHPIRLYIRTERLYIHFHNKTLLLDLLPCTITSTRVHCALMFLAILVIDLCKNLVLN